MTVTAWAVEDCPLWLIRRSDEYDTFSWDALVHEINVGHVLDDPPATPRWPRGEQLLHAAHVCSKKGSVRPRPSFPAAGWQ